MNSLLVISILNELELICLHASITIVSKQLNGFNYCNLTQISLFNINHLFVHSQVVSSILFNTIQHYSFICTPSNGSKYCYIIPIVLFAHS